MLRRTRDEWLELVERQKGSGLSVAEFCRRNGLTENSFYRWRRLLGDEVEVPFVSLSVVASPTVDVELPGGAIVKAAASRETLREVFAALLSVEVSGD